MIDRTGVAMDKEKVLCVVNWPYPKSIKEVRGFLRLIGYYRRFVRHYGTIAQPITALLKTCGMKRPK